MDDHVSQVSEQGLSFQIGEQDHLGSLLELYDDVLPSMCFEEYLEGFTSTQDHGAPLGFSSDRGLSRYDGSLSSQEPAAGAPTVEDSLKSKTQASSQLKVRRKKGSMVVRQSVEDSVKSKARASSQLKVRKEKGILVVQQSPQRSLEGGVVRPRKEHFLSERYRRKTMSEQLETLRSLIPSHPLAKDRFSTLSAAEDYIRNLQNEIHELGMKKTTLISSFVENTGTNIVADRDSRDIVPSTRSIIEVLSLGHELFISLAYSSELKPASEILLMLEAYALDVLNVNISLRGNEVFHTIHAFQKDDKQKLSTQTLKQALSGLFSLRETNVTMPV